MKKLLLYTVFLFASVVGYAQNLMSNGSFEQYSSCPNGGSQINYSIGWFPFSGTPDYFDSCSAPGFVSVPSNIAGIRYAADGGAYCLLQSYIEGDSIYSNYEREIVGGQLSTPMVIGQKYYVSFKVNLVLKSDLGANLATNKLGALFSTVSYSNTDSSTIVPVNNFAHVYTDSVINDTLNWTMISGSFVADSAYQYISIGNFFQYQNMTIITRISTPWVPTAGYFVDDVRVSTDSVFTVTNTELISKENSLYLYPNPSSGTVKIKMPNLKANSIVFVYDLLGQEVYSSMVKANDNIDLSFLNNGFYNVVINNSSLQYSTTKLLIQK
jgi:hypothetical protein